MAESLLVGAAVGAAFGELLKAVLEAKDNATKFQSTLENLTKTLIAIDPLVKEIQQHNINLDRPKEELESLIRDMEEGTKLVYKCSKISRINIYRRRHYQEQLAALANSLERFFKIDMQAQTARDVKETLLEMRRMRSMVNQLHLFGTPSSSHNSATEAVDSSQLEVHEPTNENAVETSSTEEAIVDHPARLLPSGSGVVPDCVSVSELEHLESNNSTQPTLDAVWTNNSAEQAMEDITILSQIKVQQDQPIPQQQAFPYHQPDQAFSYHHQSFPHYQSDQPCPQYHPFPIYESFSQYQSLSVPLPPPHQQEVLASLPVTNDNVDQWLNLSGNNQQSSPVQSRHKIEPSRMSLDARGSRRASRSILSRGRKSVDSSGSREFGMNSSYNIDDAQSAPQRDFDLNVQSSELGVQEDVYRPIAEKIQPQPIFSPVDQWTTSMTQLAHIEHGMGFEDTSTSGDVVEPKFVGDYDSGKEGGGRDRRRRNSSPGTHWLRGVGSGLREKIWPPSKLSFSEKKPPKGK